MAGRRRQRQIPACRSTPAWMVVGGAIVDLTPEPAEPRRSEGMEPGSEQSPARLDAALRLRLEVEDLLYRDAALLDEWRLDDWLDLLTPDVRYVIPTTDLPDGVPLRDVVFVNDDFAKLQARVERLESRHAHREYPSSRTRRLITNVRVRQTSPDNDIDVTASFVIYRIRGEMAPYVGRYDMRVRRTPDGMKIAYRRAQLDLETLRDHGAVSIIL